MSGVDYVASNEVSSVSFNGVELLMLGFWLSSILVESELSTNELSKFIDSNQKSSSNSNWLFLTLDFSIPFNVLAIPAFIRDELEKLLILVEDSVFNAESSCTEL